MVEKFCDSTAQDMISGPHLEYGLLLTECQELCLENTLRLWQQKDLRGGGLKQFLCSSLLGEMIQID